MKHQLIRIGTVLLAMAACMAFAQDKHKPTSFKEAVVRSGEKKPTSFKQAVTRRRTTSFKRAATRRHTSFKSAVNRRHSKPRAIVLRRDNGLHKGWTKGVGNPHRTGDKPPFGKSHTSSKSKTHSKGKAHTSSKSHDKGKH